MVLPGIVLAAGASSRMGQIKTLLPIQPGRTFLGRVLATLTEARIAPLVVVSRNRIDITAAWDDVRSADVVQAINPDPTRGQLSSLLCGLDALATAWPAVVMTLVDVPLPRAETVRLLVDVWCRTQAPLVRPVFQRRRGHPAVFGASLLDRLRAADLAEGAKPVIRAFGDRAIDVEVDDPGVLVDVDTPEDYRRLVEGS